MKLFKKPKDRHAELVEASLPLFMSFNEAVEMLRQAQHDGLIGSDRLPKQLPCQYGTS
ncbi:hypothetical protein [Hymenobacter metallilatus]|uniref:hypothetical protein n=1 Tax=Hymenobacter metallilatus TaxID=2493666 RepID=UPI00163A9C58|nr:hypothetical protein [Hymenobacter metallilatus]